MNLGIIHAYNRSDPAMLAAPRIVATKGSVSMQDDSTPNPAPYGYCHCNCGNRTSIATMTKTSRGYRKGEPVRFIPGHQMYLRPFQANTVSILHDGSIAMTLTKGYTVIIDSESYDSVKDIRWHAGIGNDGIAYAVNKSGPRNIFMHRIIMDSPTVSSWIPLKVRLPTTLTVIQ